jgi:hypothetical protein
LVALLQLLSTAYSKLQVSVQGQNTYTKAQEASNLWEPDNKGQVQQNGASITWLQQRVNTSQVPGFSIMPKILYRGINRFSFLLSVFVYRVFEINVI